MDYVHKCIHLMHSNVVTRGTPDHIVVTFYDCDFNVTYIVNAIPMNIELYIMNTVPIFSCEVPELEFMNQYTPIARNPMPIPNEAFQAFLNLRKFIFYTISYYLDYNILSNVQSMT